MTLYKVHFTAGLTELETEVHPSPGMQRRVGDGSAPGDYPRASEPPVERVGTPLLAQPLPPSSNRPLQEEGLVPGEPRTCLPRAGFEWFAFTSLVSLQKPWGGLRRVTGLRYPAVDLKPGLFGQPHLFLRGLPPDGRVVSALSPGEGAEL